MCSKRQYDFTQPCPTLWDPLDYRAHLAPCPWNSQGSKTGAGCHFLLQGIFPAQGSNPHLLRWQAGSLPPDLPGKPNMTSAMSQNQTHHLGLLLVLFWMVTDFISHNTSPFCSIILPPPAPDYLPLNQEWLFLSSQIAYTLVSLLEKRTVVGRHYTNIHC